MFVHSNIRKIRNAINLRRKISTSKIYFFGAVQRCRTAFPFRHIARTEVLSCLLSNDDIVLFIFNSIQQHVS